MTTGRINQGAIHRSARRHELYEQLVCYCYTLCKRIGVRKRTDPHVVSFDLFLTSLCITFQLARPMLSQRVERSSDRVSFKFLSQNTHRCNATRERSMHMWNLSFKTVLKQELLRFQATGRSQNT